MKQQFKAIARKTPLYRVWRRIAAWRHARRLVRQFGEWSGDDLRRLAFYRQFAGPGDVVFDIGANMGNRAKVFHKLGAVVVAAEPQRACADFLRRVFGNKPRFHLVAKALGASPGEAEMLVSDDHPMSSLSPGWVRSVTESGRFGHCRWDRTEKVPVDTLDNLIARFGLPAFVKIDVEGFEEQVVSGLSVPVPALSVEFSSEYMENTRKCVDLLCRLGRYRFQISLGESMEFALAHWVSREEIEKELSRIPPLAFGDLYARVDSRP